MGRRVDPSRAGLKACSYAGAGLKTGGYVLGNVVPNIEQRIHYVVAIVIAVSLLPPGIAWFRRKRRS